MDLAFADKLAKEKTGVKIILLHQGLFDRTVDANGMQTIVSQETVRTFSTMITKQNCPEEKWFDKET